MLRICEIFASKMFRKGLRPCSAYALFKMPTAGPEIPNSEFRIFNSFAVNYDLGVLLWKQV